MFLASTPRLVAAQCRAGIVGAMPALNARSTDLLDGWLAELAALLEQPARAGTHPAAPFAINQIVSRTNTRQEQDLAVLVKHRVPIVITSVGAPGDVVAAVHGYGGLVFHDVVSVKHAEKAVAAGMDGIVAVCAGAGGHGGTLNPFAFVNEIRRFYSGTLLLAGTLTSGKDLVAARVMGADLGYIGTRFFASEECEIARDYKQMLVSSNADGIVNTALFSGLRGNYLAPSIVRSGLDPDNLPLPAVACQSGRRDGRVRRIQALEGHLGGRPRGWWRHGHSVGCRARRATRNGIPACVKPIRCIARMRRVMNCVTMGLIAQQAIRRAVREGLQLPLTDALALERTLGTQVAATADAREGIQAFLEKRAPVFRDA
ncbi:nitronate monooxygenase [Paraburkholderia saeva]|uniref:nitronate monooxygenase n=1 Tax=Paraburkholderia saeva TaxID=2777537 RepID=UPI002B4B98ED|nr:nitronate monooxygenase [Paraburkholderia saeva]